MVKDTDISLGDLADNALLVLFANGSKPAAMELTRRLGPKVFRHAYYRLQNKSMRSYHTREMRQMDRAGYENALVLLRATPFDPEALEDQMEDQTEASEERLEYAREALIAHLAAMSDTERAEFADALEHALKRGPKRKKQP